MINWLPNCLRQSIGHWSRKRKKETMTPKVFTKQSAEKIYRIILTGSVVVGPEFSGAQPGDQLEVGEDLAWDLLRSGNAELVPGETYPPNRVIDFSSPPG